MQRWTVQFMAFGRMQRLTVPANTAKDAAAIINGSGMIAIGGRQNTGVPVWAVQGVEYPTKAKAIRASDKADKACVSHYLQH